MLFNEKHDRDVVNCMISAEKRGRDSRRGEMSKAQYHQKSRFVDLSSKRDRRKRARTRDEDQKKWYREYVGTADIPHTIEEIKEAVYREYGLELDVRWSAQGPKTAYKFTSGYDSDLMATVREHGWPSVIRPALGLEVE